jgi:hypothetical protein
VRGGATAGDLFAVGEVVHVVVNGLIGKGYETSRTEVVLMKKACVRAAIEPDHPTAKPDVGLNPIIVSVALSDDITIGVVDVIRERGHDAQQLVR